MQNFYKTICFYSSNLSCRETKISVSKRTFQNLGLHFKAQAVQEILLSAFCLESQPDIFQVRCKKYENITNVSKETTKGTRNYRLLRMTIKILTCITNI